MEALLFTVSAINDFMHANRGLDAIGLVTASAVLVALTTIAALEAADRRTREAPRREPNRAPDSREQAPRIAA